MSNVLAGEAAIPGFGECRPGSKLGSDEIMLHYIVYRLTDLEPVGRFVQLMCNRPKQTRS